MAKKSKRYTEAAALIENGRLYSAEEAIELVKKTSNVKFDASVDVAFNLGLDVRQADQQLRGALLEQPDIDGALVGGASLVEDSYKAMIAALD